MTRPEWPAHPLDTCNHIFVEVRRWREWSAGDTGEAAPPGIPIRVQEECTLCGVFRERFE